MMYGLGQMFFPGFGFILQVILFIIFLYIIYWVLKSGKMGLDSPEDILKKRLAKGEITKKEYLDLLKEIKE